MMLDVEPSTRRGYTFMIEKHIRPLLGRVQVARVDAELLETLYARLRKCRHHCNGRRFVEHRTSRPHDCDVRCKLHICKGLSASSVRQIHWIPSGAFDKAIRWKWIAINPVDQADKPALPHPDPRPPSVADASRIVTAAWRDPAAARPRLSFGLPAIPAVHAAIAAIESARAAAALTTDQADGEAEQTADDKPAPRGPILF